jgi:stress response protein YsnF
MEKLQKKVEDIEDTIIPLIGEKSDESRNIKVDQTTLTKEPVIETKTVQVPLVHEEVTIEKRPPNNKTKAQPPATSTKNMAINKKGRDRRNKNTLCYKRGSS